jgi:GT2 family glycosyltransferase
VPPDTARVKIGIPTFNRSPLLRNAIESVLRQTYQNFVLDISDNASTDDTPDVVATFDDPRIVYRRRPENVGLFANYNQFYIDARTGYLLVLPDDDVLHPRFLERTVQALDKSPNAGIVHTGFDVIDQSGKTLGGGNWTGGLTENTIESPIEFIVQSMRWSCRVCAPTALVRVAAIPEGGMPKDDFPASDFALWLRIAAAGYDVIFLAERLASSRVHAAAESAAHIGSPQGGSYPLDLRTVDRVRKVKLRFIAEHGLDVGNVEELRRLIRWGAQLQILSMVRRRTLERRGLRLRRARFIAEAARIDWAIVLNETLWRYVAADVLKPIRRRLLRDRSFGDIDGGRGQDEMIE